MISRRTLFKNSNVSYVLTVKLSIWDSLRTSENPPSEEDIEKMEAEFKQLMESQKDSSLAEYNYGASMAEAWENGLGQYDGDMMPSTRFDEEGVPILEPYNFGKQFLYSMTLCYQFCPFRPRKQISNSV